MKTDFTKLHRAFNPECVVVVGDKDRFAWIKGQSKFKGKLYSVQVNPDTIKMIEALGVKNYTSLLDIPDPIDLVIVAVPRTIAPKILDECIQKDVAAAHFFTAGFTESDTEEGKKLERTIIEKAKQANFCLIGPNCMGIFNPKLGIKQQEEQYDGVSGPVGFISQSGNIAIIFALESQTQGILVNKTVSFGNGVILDSPDYLEYFGQDKDIQVIGMYIEGLKDGKRFLSVLKEVCARKPVVIWKGGRTEGGGERAIASHTGSMAISQTIWSVAIKQCGAIGVANMQELIDTVKALTYLTPVRGNKMGIAGGSGGQSVSIADAFAEADLELPSFTQKSYDELASFWRPIGGGYPNPIDTGNENRKEMKRILEIIEQDANVDNIAVVMTVRMGLRTPEELEDNIRLMIELRENTLKPLIVIIPTSTLEELERLADVTKKLQDGNIPTFPTFERGARALRNALDYYNFRRSIEA
ncbi:MAG: CoA-binding protein [Thermodesulfobacteriota bacterium]|nr:CoA-binding protein [Thermodesulfobacteriota bacterium]